MGGDYVLPAVKGTCKKRKLDLDTGIGTKRIYTDVVYYNKVGIFFFQVNCLEK